MEKILLVQLSACLSETITYPIDYMKTLLQVNKRTSNYVIQHICSNYSQIYNSNDIKNDIKKIQTNMLNVV